MPPAPRVAFAAAFFALAAPFPFAAAQQPADGPSQPASRPNVETFVLDNGLDVRLRPLPSATRAAVAISFAIGEDHDPADLSGTAHAFEHLFCTAAAGAAPARTYEAWAAAHPDKAVNAQTGADATFVACVVKPEDLAAELADFAARLADLKPTEADLVRERARLKVELGNMYGGMPALAAGNHARALLRPFPGGGRPGGLDATFDALTVERLRERAKHYGAGVARLAVAGKFDAAEVAALVRARFGAVPRGAGAPPLAARPAPELGRIKVVDAPPGAQGPGTVALAFPTRRVGDPEFAAYLSVVSALLTRGMARGDGGAPSFRAAPLDDATFAVASAALRPDETPEAAVARLDAWVAERVAAAGKTSAAQARQFFRMAIDAGRAPEPTAARNPYGAALSLAQARDLADLDRAAAGFEGLTDEEIRRVGRALFAPSARAAAVVRPAPR